MKDLKGKRWWSALLFATAVVIVYKVVDNVDVLWSGLGKLMGVLTPFIIGLLIAALLFRPVSALERLFKKCRFRLLSAPARVWAIVLVYLALLGVLALAMAVIVPLVIQGVTGLIDVLPGYLTQAKVFLDDLGRQDGFLAAVNMDDLLQSGLDFVKQYLTAENLLGYVSGLVSITSSFVTVLIAFIISIYMLAGRESLLSTLRRLGESFFPERAVSLVAHYCSKAVNIFARYVSSMLLDALCICILMIPGMYISGIPNPLSFAVCVGIANLIPYFGAIISGVVAVVVLLLSGHWGMAVFLAVYVLVAQQVDANVLQPRIYSQSVGIKPLYVLLAITVGGGLGGFVGMLVGVPSMAVLQMLMGDFVRHRARVKAARAGEQSTEE